MSHYYLLLLLMEPHRELKQEQSNLSLMALYLFLLLSQEIPFRTGIRKVVLKNQYQSAETAFTAYGTRHLYERINKQHITETITNYRRIYIDPLAETFYNPEPSFITKLDLYFKSKDSGNIPIIVQIRNVDNGYPGEEVLTQK